MSRIEYLLLLHHDWVEGKQSAWDGMDIEQLSETQLKNGEISLGTRNIASQVKNSFELANLYWGQGNVEQARFYMRKTVDRYKRLIEACAEYNYRLEVSGEIHFAKCAALLLGEEFRGSALIEDLKLGYEPWFKDRLMDYCLGSEEFDMNSWQASVDQWTKSGFPKYRIEEFAFYMRSLTGAFDSIEAMFAAHEKLVAARSKRNPDSDMLDGYTEYAALTIDYIFAAILTRIGWKGIYRHSWPNSAVFGAAPQTTRLPDRFLGTIPLRSPDPDADTGIIADAEQARRFIDKNLENQRDYEGRALDPKRSRAERGKVAAALKDIGWVADPATLDLMRTYDMENVLNDQAGVFLGDPFGSDIRLKHSTNYLRSECGLPDDFISIAGNIEAYHPDLDGGWYLYRKRDGKVYLLDRSEWEAPQPAIKAARAGLNMWPSYTSFVAWWVAQHQAGLG